MDNICEQCDTRVRLKKCSGKDGEFRFCLRKVGSLDGLEKTITSFNNIQEIFGNPCDYIQGLDRESLVLDYKPYGKQPPLNMMLLWGRFSNDTKAKEKDICYPVAYVTCSEAEFFGGVWKMTYEIEDN